MIIFTFKHLLLALVLLHLISCASTPNAPVTPEKFHGIASAHVLAQNPDLAPSTFFKVKEFEVDGLWEAMSLQLFVVGCMTSPTDEWTFREDLFIYHRGEVIPFAIHFGGFGLTSASVHDGDLFYTYSWGSGIHRSHIGRVSLKSGQLEISDSGGFIDYELFIDSSNTVYDAKFKDFNSWSSEVELGSVRYSSNELPHLEVIGLDGSLIISDFSPSP